MSRDYRATFVIPLGARRILGDGGWEFFSRNRIPQEIVGALMADLALVESDSYLGMQEFFGEHVKAIVLRDKQGQAETVYFRAYGDRDVHDELLRALSALRNRGAVEVFSPSR